MNLYVWIYVEQLTNNYHPGGGFVAIAETEQRARELAAILPGCQLKETEKPDFVAPIEAEETAFVFADKGCC